VRKAFTTLALVLTAGASGMLGPAPASAATTYFPTNAVHPVLECVARASDGSWTAVLGYTNSGAAKTVPLGSWNSMSPASYNGAQPTSYKAGTQHGVLALKISAVDYSGGGVTWMLDGNLIFVGATFSAGIPTCTAVQMPAEGNDTGSAIALVAAGALGVLVLVRLRRRLTASLPPTAAPAEERADA
jgi:hypothetical protein